MRILLDYRPALRLRTGVGHYVHELAAALQPQLGPGESLVLFSSSWRDRLDPHSVRGAQCVDVRVPVRVLNAAWHRLEWPVVESFAGPVDVVHSPHPLLMPARAGVVRAVTIHDLDFLDHPERSRAEIKRDYPSLARQHASRADLVVVNSEHTARAVETRFAVPRQRLVVCRPGVPAAVPTTSDAAPDGRSGPILFVGTIEPRKNLPTLFASYEQLVAERPDAPPLVLAGRSIEASDTILAEIGRRPALRGRVEYRGYVSDEERQRLYSEASMLVLPSLDEGFGMPAAEAMQAGLPVIVSDRGALPEVVGQAGIVVGATEPSAFTAAMVRLLDDPAEREQLQQAGRRRAAGLSWKASAAALLHAYRQAFARKRETG